MNPILPQEVVQEKTARVIPIKIGDVPSLNLQKEFHLKAAPIKYLLWKEHLWIQV